MREIGTECSRRYENDNSPTRGKKASRTTVETLRAVDDTVDGCCDAESSLVGDGVLVSPTDTQALLGVIIVACVFCSSRLRRSLNASLASPFRTGHPRSSLGFTFSSSSSSSSPSSLLLLLLPSLPPLPRLFRCAAQLHLPSPAQQPASSLIDDSFPSIYLYIQLIFIIYTG
ncbi:hypothetical protein MAP00_001134 [Monascus purpureus]|nr:hypothetical protein MAP00_001134 [Monascus purpureus]